MEVGFGSKGKLVCLEWSSDQALIKIWSLEKPFSCRSEGMTFYFRISWHLSVFICAKEDFSLFLQIKCSCNSEQQGKIVRAWKVFWFNFWFGGFVYLFGVFCCFLSRTPEFHVLIRCYGNQVLRKELVNNAWLVRARARRSSGATF